MTIGLTGLNRGENPQPGYAAIRSIRREFENQHQLIGLVYDPLESGIYADDGPDMSYTMPYPSAGADPFLARIDAIQNEVMLDALIPSLDAELEPLVRMREPLAERGIKVSVPTSEAFEARHKHKLSSLAERCGVRTPLTFAISSAEEINGVVSRLSLPVMVKGRYYGAKRANTLADLQRYFAETIAQWGGPVLIQEIVIGEEYNLVGLCSEPGRLDGWAALKKTVVSAEGKGFGGITMDDPQLTEMAEALVKELQWTGPFELEVLRDGSGQYSIIEINPRFPAWVDFPSMLGVNLPAALVHYLSGEEISIPKCPSGKMFLRHNIELCCDIEDVGNLSGTGKLETKK